MSLRWRKIIGFIGLVIVATIIIWVTIEEPGIRVSDPAELNGKLRERIVRKLDPQARIVQIYFFGDGAFTKIRYASIGYFVPGDEACRYLSLYLDGSGSSSELTPQRPMDGITIVQGLPLDAFDFGQMSTYANKIKELLADKGEKWMGFGSYAIDYDPQEAGFVHRIEARYESEKTATHIFSKLYWGVTAHKPAEFLVHADGEMVPLD